MPSSFTLLDNQTVDFDTHSRGDRKAVEYGNGLHMHKRMNSDRHRGVDVIVPIDKSGDLIFRGRTIKSKQQQEIVSEIKKVLKKNDNKREQLVDTVINEIRRYSGSIPDAQAIDNIRQGASNLAEAMGLNRKIIDEIKSIVENRIENYVSAHSNDEGKLYYIKQDFLRKKIKMSDSLEKLFYANN